MKRTALLIGTVALLAACGSSGPQPISQQQMVAELQTIYAGNLNTAKVQPIVDVVKRNDCHNTKDQARLEMAVALDHHDERGIDITRVVMERVCPDHLATYDQARGELKAITGN